MNLKAKKIQRWIPVLLLFSLFVAVKTGPASGASLFGDEFRRTTGLGPNWRITAGSFTTDGELALTGGAANAAAITLNIGTNDYTVEAVMTVPAGSIYSGIIARGRTDAQFTSDLYSLQLSSKGTVNLYRRNGGVWTLLKSAPAGIVAGQAYRIGLKVTGSDPVDLQVFLNGTLLFSYQDAASARILTGVPGVINYNSGVKYDRFTVTTDDGPPINRPPAARMTASPASGTAPIRVTFDGSTSSDPDGTISSHAWNFGDGTTGTGSIVDHTYSSPGTFTAVLTVTDNKGSAGSAQTTITVGPPPVNQPPVARAAANPTSGLAPLTVQFDGSASSDPDGTVISYLWEFGDGTAGAGSITGRTYGQPGSYTATLTVTDNDGAAASSQVAITVGLAGGGILFHDDFNRTAGLGPDWKIQVGSFATDGSMAVSQGSQNWAALVSDLKSNDYTVESVLTLPAGSLYSGVVVRGSPAASFYQNLYAAQLSTKGTANLYRRNNGTWTLLKGAPAGVVANKPYTLRLKVIGSNPVNLEVSLNGLLLFSYADASASRLPAGIPGIQNYNSGVRYDRFTVHSAANQFPAARIDAAPASGPAPLAVRFDGSASSDPDGTIVSYTWTFGDGTTGAGRTIDHMYEAEGIYSAELTVTDDAGATAATRTSIVVGAAVVSRFAYAANSGSNDITLYTIDAATGTLTRTGSVPAGLEPYVIAVDPKGRFAYAGNFGSNDLSIYRIDPATGILTPAGTATTGISPYSIAVDPSGRFLYAANENSATDVWMYRIDPASGALALIGTVSAGTSPISITVDPLGAYAYVANTSSDNVSMYRLDRTTGALTRLGEVAAGNGANSVAIDPSGRFAYVANYDSNDVTVYTLDRATGRLTRTGSVPAGGQPFSIAVDPSGKFAYAANSSSNNVSMYRIDGSSGGLTSLGSVAAGSGPRSVTVDRSGKFVYVANLNTNDLFVYSIDRATGLLTAEGRTPAGMTTRSVATVSPAQ